MEVLEIQPREIDTRVIQPFALIVSSCDSAIPMAITKKWQVPLAAAGESKAMS